MRVILDAEVLRRDPTQKGPFRALAQLAKREQIELYIPEFAVREFLESEGDKVRESADKLAQAVRGFQVFALPDGWKVDLKDLLAELNEAVDLAKRNYSDSFMEWCQKRKISIELIDPTCASEVVNDYFEGRHFFKNRRSRKDFPDGFIWASILKICREPGPIAFVTGDDFFRSGASDQLPNLRCFASVESLLEQSDLGEILKIGILDSQLERITELCQDALPFRPSIEDEIARAIRGRRVSIFFPVESVPFIESVEKIEAILLGRRPTTYYGDGFVLLPFSACASCTLKVEVPEEAILPSRRDKFLFG